MQVTPTRLRLQLAAIVSCLLVVVPTASGQRLVEGFSIAPGVLVDPANGVAYLMTPERKVEAVALTDGGVLWSSSAAARPIAIRGERIIAQVEAVVADTTLTLVALDATNGEPVGPPQAIDLGPGVVSSVDDGLEHQFVLGTAEADTRIGPVLWRYYEQELSGPEEPPAPPFERFGALEVSDAAAITPLTGGGFTRESGRPPYSRPRVTRPVSEEPAPGTIILDLETGGRYRPDGVRVPPAGGSGSDPTRAPSEPVPVTLPPGGLIITDGHVGDEFPPTRRIPGDQFGESADDRHLVASEFTGVIEAPEPYRWTIYRRGTLEVAARFVAQTSLTPFVLTANRVLYLRQPYQRRAGDELQSHPLALVARDAGSGRIVWTRAVRDTRYQGPVPE
jgi:hypothetical protein